MPFSVMGFIIGVSRVDPAPGRRMHCASSPDYVERRDRILQFYGSRPIRIDVHHVNGSSVHVAYVEP
ncbi:MAG: hypothetical protein ACO2PM_11025 [Pyrobaculum sp.]